MALPIAISAPLIARFASIEALLHREGYAVGALLPEPPPEPSLFLAALGHEDVVAPELVRVFFVTARRSIATGAPLPLLAAEVAATAEACRGALLGASLPQFPAALLAARSDTAARAASALLGGPIDATQREGVGALVDYDALVNFVFPPGEQHPRSTGRLIAFALHGPLRDGALVGGARGARALTPRELNTVIDCIEGEDSRNVFAGASALGAPLPRTCATPLPDISRAHLARLLAPLPRTANGALLPFPAVQAAVLAAREARVADLRKHFPAPPSAAEAARRLLPAPPFLGRGVLDRSLEPSAAPLRAAREAAQPGGGARDVWRKRTEILRRREEVGLLHQRLGQVAHVWSTGSSALIPALLANVSLVRPRGPTLDGSARSGVDAAADVGTRPGWRAEAPFSLHKNVGTCVPASRDASRYLPEKRLDAPVLLL